MTLHTQSWDELADAVLTHDGPAQRQAWTPESGCAAPVFRLADITIPPREVDPARTAVEDVLQLRHDIDDHDLAVRLLTGIRHAVTGETMPCCDVEYWIGEFLEAGQHVRDAEQNGSYSDFVWCIDQYEYKLASFLGGRR